MLACFLFQVHRLLDLCHWAQWRSSHLSAIRIVHARNLVKAPPGCPKSNTGGASSLSSGNDVLTFQLTPASDQIDAQIPTATAKARRQLTRSPLTASCRWSSKRVYEQYRAKRLRSSSRILSHGGPPLARYIRRGVLSSALLSHTTNVALVVRLCE